MGITIVSFLAVTLLVQAESPKHEQGSVQHARPFTLKMSTEGHVELTVLEEDKASGKPLEKTYKADSVDEFRRKYPEVSKHYPIHRVLEWEEWMPLRPENLDKKFEEWKLRFDGHWFWDRDQEAELENWFRALPKSLHSDEMTQWFEEQRKMFEKFRQLRPKVNPDPEAGSESSKSRPKLGVLIAPVGDTLANQLGFEKVEGVIIAEIKSGSLADRSGLRKNDIVIKINGKSIPDTAFFQKEALASGEGFQLEILRRGKHETIKVDLK